MRDVALQHEVCPYYLRQELTRWADVVVGDYNYYFDLGGLLHGLAQANQWRTALLVDEAHNLVERGRKMFTAELHPAALAQARSSATAAQHAPVKKALDKVRRAWVALDKAAPGAVHGARSLPRQAAGRATAVHHHLTEHFTDHPTEPWMARCNGVLLRRPAPAAHGRPARCAFDGGHHPTFCQPTTSEYL